MFAYFTLAKDKLHQAELLPLDHKNPSLAPSYDSHT